MTDSTRSSPKGAFFYLPAILSVALLLAAWKVGALISASDLILPPPERVIGALFSLLAGPKFALAFAATFTRGIIAFAFTLFLGAAFGIAAGISAPFRSFLRPILAVIRSTPVLALILLLLIWFPQDAVPVISAVLMSFPVLIAAVIAGMEAADTRLLETARLFRMRKKDVFFSVRLPALLPFLLSGASGCLGLIWKVVVAGEVLSLPLRAIGTGLREAKNYLDTPKAMAWALSAVLLCGITDAAFALATRTLKHGH